MELNFVLMMNLSWFTSSALSKSYVINRPLKLQKAYSKFLSGLIYLLVFTLGLMHFLNFSKISNLEFGVTYTSFFFLVLFARSILFMILDNLRKQGYNNRKIVVIGDEDISARTINSLKEHPEYGYQIVDYISNLKLNNLSLFQLKNALIKSAPNEIFVCYRQIDNQFLNNLIEFAEEHEIKVKVISDLFLDDKHAQLIIYHNMPAILVTSQPEIDLKIVLTKRSFDIAFSSVIMAMGFPVFCILYVVTILTSKGPAFYRQQRIGKKGRPFNIYKFRSMYLNSELDGPQLSSNNDQRITKWGKMMRKTRLDELPQFWNVLKGEMSVVGPRPERQHFIEKIIERKPVYRQLMKIKPGLTSMGQVGYGYAENIDQICDRVGHDLPYLQNMTINSDLNIILKTIKVMVQCKGK